MNLCVPIPNLDTWTPIQRAVKKELHELVLFSGHRTTAFDESYVKAVVKIWNKAKVRPASFKACRLNSQWRSPYDAKVVGVHSIVHEYYFTLLYWVDKLVEKKNFISIVNACIIIRWHLMPYAKIFTSKTNLFLFSEEGCKHLLAIVLVKLMLELIQKSEAAKAVSSVFCGMIQWVLNQTTLLVQLKSPFAGEAQAIKTRLEALMILYVPGDNAEHEMALALEAMKRFHALNDDVRYQLAKSKVSATAAMPPTSRYRPISPVGPSTIKLLNSNKNF